MTTYIAGPMRGIPRFNFPAFDEASATLRVNGWDVISPAEMDREAGFDPNHDIPDIEFLRTAFLRDVNAIVFSADAITMLPGWNKSVGATAEFWIARMFNLPIYLYPEMELWNQTDRL